MSNLVKFTLIAAGGAVGALLRYVVSGWAYRWAGTGFPWGTLSVNVLGSFVIGFLWAASERAPFGPRWTPFVFIGVLGAFTTFSTYALESLNLFREGELRLAAVNLLASNVLALLAVVLGFLSARYLFAPFR
jgi:CrcB protein